MFSTELEEIMGSSRDYSTLYEVWTGWRDVAAAPARENYTEYIRLSNLAANASSLKMFFQHNGTLYSRFPSKNSFSLFF